MLFVLQKRAAKTSFASKAGVGIGFSLKRACEMIREEGNNVIQRTRRPLSSLPNLEMEKLATYCNNEIP
jgi:hypothetical protein